VRTRPISFDRAADFYDATRALPQGAGDALADVLAAELAGRGPCLEIGVGTGRIALPLHARGVALAGVDVAAAMLRRLVANAGGLEPFPLLQADVTRLPLAASSFGAVLACHVFHLIADWRAAADEAMRVLRPHGVLVVDFGGGARAPWSARCQEILRRHGVVHDRPGVSAPGDVSAHLGRPPRPLPPVVTGDRRSLARDLDRWERQIDAWTWPYPAGQMRAACAGIRDWVAANGYPVDREVELRGVLQWWAFERAC
jgi:SAM-dependent methyltransferase